MRRLIIRLLILSIPALSCKEPEEVGCDQYYLTEVSQYDFQLHYLTRYRYLYSADGLVASMGPTGTEWQFTYDNSKRMVLAVFLNYFSAELRYDSKGRPVTIVQKSSQNLVSADSVTQEYDAEDRMIRRTLYYKYEHGFRPTEFYRHEYEGRNTKTMYRHEVVTFPPPVPPTGPVRNTYVYSYDDKRRPQRPEYISFVDAVGIDLYQPAAENNAITIDEFGEDGSHNWKEIRSYYYNQAGYPTALGLGLDPGKRTFRYSCTPN